jgi:hypothetical protein
MIKELPKLLLTNIQGAADPELPVLAGLDAIVKLEGKIVAWATNVSFDEDYELQGIRTLGKHGDRGYKSQGYNCTVTVGTFVLVGSIADNLPVPTRRTILTSGLVDFELLDLNSGKTLYVLRGCKCATHGVNLDSGSLSSKSTTWRCMEIIPQEGNVS